MAPGSSVTLPPIPTTSSNLSLLQLLSRDKLTGPNYIDWIGNLRITLRYEKKKYALDEYLAKELPGNATKHEFVQYKKHFHYSIEVSCLMLAATYPKLQKWFENLGAIQHERAAQIVKVKLVKVNGQRSSQLVKVKLVKAIWSLHDQWPIPLWITTWQK